MRNISFVFCILIALNVQAISNTKLDSQLQKNILPKIDSILVEKHKHSMTVFYQNQPLKQYRVALGFSPEGHKHREGDGKTPEGLYYIVGKNPNSQFHLSLKLSYPSPHDQFAAFKQGFNPGSNIMIHGLSPYNEKSGKWHTMRDWTRGCTAVTNEEIEEIFKLADIGTPVKILP